MPELKTPARSITPRSRPRDLPPFDPANYPPLPEPIVTLTRGHPPLKGPVPYFMLPPKPDVVKR